MVFISLLLVACSYPPYTNARLLYCGAYSAAFLLVILAVLAVNDDPPLVRLIVDFVLR